VSMLKNLFSIDGKTAWVRINATSRRVDARIATVQV
jgi:hypothetical protein